MVSSIYGQVIRTSLPCKSRNILSPFHELIAQKGTNWVGRELRCFDSKVPRFNVPTHTCDIFVGRVFASSRVHEGCRTLVIPDHLMEDRIAVWTANICGAVPVPMLSLGCAKEPPPGEQMLFLPSADGSHGDGPV